MAICSQIRPSSELSIRCIRCPNDPQIVFKCVYMYSCKSLLVNVSCIYLYHCYQIPNFCT
ncbi:hypothetical protein Hanom_Chr16g01427591 [Helianthus anomalus]